MRKSILKYYSASLATIAVLACAGSIRAAGPVTVGDPKQPGRLAQAVQNNHFFANYQGDIDVQWADGITLAGNVLAGAPAWPPAVPHQSPVSLAHSRAVTLRANVVRNPSAYRPALVSLGADVTGLQGNNATGIH